MNRHVCCNTLGNSIYRIAGAILIVWAMLSASTSWARAVYVMSGGTAWGDRAVLDALIARGHTPTLGVELWQWNGTQANLKDFEVVVLLNNYNYASPAMPAAGQEALLKYVSEGGGLVTGEWLISNFYWIWKESTLSPAIPQPMETAHLRKAQLMCRR